MDENQKFRDQLKAQQAQEYLELAKQKEPAPAVWPVVGQPSRPGDPIQYGEPSSPADNLAGRRPDQVRPYQDKADHEWCPPLSTPPESRAVEMDLNGTYVMGKKVDGLWHTLDNLKTPVIPKAWRYVGK